MHSRIRIPAHPIIKSFLYIILGSIPVTLFVLPQHIFSAENRQLDLGSSFYRGPIIDAHNHPRRKNIFLQKFFKEVKMAGVEKVIVMTTPNDYRKSRRSLLRNTRNFSGSRTLCSANFVGSIHAKNYNQALRDFENMKTNLENGICIGIGEVGLRHYDKTAKQGGNNRGQPVVLVNLNHKMVLRMFRLADIHNVPVVLHVEPVYSTDAIDKLLAVKNWYKNICRKFSRAKLILAHNGMMSPKDLEELFLNCGNLFADFKFMHSRGAIAGFQDLHPMNDLNFELFPHWGHMIQKYPERFIFGSDWKYGRRNSFEDYAGHIQTVRKMVGILSPAIQRMILYENAKRLYSID